MAQAHRRRSWWVSEREPYVYSVCIEYAEIEGWDQLKAITSSADDAFGSSPMQV